MPISPEQITAVARLARLRIDVDQTDYFSGQLSRILELVEQMNQADTSGVEPMSHPGDGALRLREDKVTHSDQSERFQALAPQARDGLYLVPKVIE